MKFSSGALTAICILLTYGCSTYMPSTVTQKNISDSALIKTDSALASETDKFIGNNALITFTKIDAEKIGSPLRWTPEEMYIPKGEHNLEFNITHRNAYLDGCLSINVKAGHNYLLKHTENGMRVHYWIIDTGDNSIVSRSCTQTTGKI